MIGNAIQSSSLALSTAGSLGGSLGSSSLDPAAIGAAAAAQLIRSLEATQTIQQQQQSTQFNQEPASLQFQQQLQLLQQQQQQQPSGRPYRFRTNGSGGFGGGNDGGRHGAVSGDGESKAPEVSIPVALPPGSGYEGSLECEPAKQDPAVPKEFLKILSRTVYVGGVTVNVTKEELRVLFEKHVRVDTVMVNYPKFNAFIKLYTRGEAAYVKDVVNRTVISDATLKTGWGCGFGPKNLFDYTSGSMLYPILQMGEADKRHISQSKRGGGPIQGGTVVEEPDLVSFKPSFPPPGSTVAIGEPVRTPGAAAPSVGAAGPEAEKVAQMGGDGWSCLEGMIRGLSRGAMDRVDRISMDRKRVSSGMGMGLVRMTGRRTSSTTLGKTDRGNKFRPLVTSEWARAGAAHGERTMVTMITEEGRTIRLERRVMRGGRGLVGREFTKCFWI
ncbi:hypothetical protein BJ742DRAFT_362413 [Cladochytrium replicatum]|nr:hypothetical protein BJ742DRAFT_362413 [Cladochytrium replicatum]